MSEHETKAVRAPAAPAGPEEGELSDSELECVIGGLTRPWETTPLAWGPAPRTP